MKTYSPMRVQVFADKAAQRELNKANTWLRQLSTQMARVPTTPQGTPAYSSNGQPSLNLNEFLYLPGRSPRQESRGAVTFEAKTTSSGGATPDAGQYGFVFTTYRVSSGARPFVNIAIEETASGRPFYQQREWTFPAFNILSSGQTQGVHYFLDAYDFQIASKKLLDHSNYHSMEDTIMPSGWFNAAWNRSLTFAWGGNYPAGGFNMAAGTITSPLGVYPSLQIPSLDYKDNGIGGRDRSHIWCMLKAPHTNTTPFEKGSLIGGGFSGRELYAMATTAHGTFAIPSGGELPQFWPTVTLTDCIMVLGNAQFSTATGTAGLKVGMRIHQNAGSYSLSEDVFVVSVDDATHATMSEAWPASNLTVTLNFFGPIWTTPASLSGSIDHGSLVGLGDDDHSQYLYLNSAAGGRSGGQVIGSTAHSGGNVNDLAIEGQLLLGTGIGGVNFTANRDFDARSSPASSNTSVANLAVNLGGVTSFSGSLNALNVLISGTPSVGAGAANIRGINFIAACGIPSGATVSELIAAQFINSLAVTNGSIPAVTTARFQFTGTGSGTPTGTTNITGIEIPLAARLLTVTDLRGIWLKAPGAAAYTSVATLNAIDIDSAFGGSAGVTLWQGLTIPAVSGPTNAWALNIGNIKSRILGNVAIGWTPPTNTAVTSQLHLGAGAATAGAAPLKLTSGTNLTSAEAGAVEYDGTDFFVTDGAGDRNRLAPRLLSRTTGIDATATGTTNLYTVPTGRSAHITHAVIRATTATAVTVEPTLGIGIAAGENDIYSDASPLTGLTSTSVEWHFDSVGIVSVGAATNIIKVGIDTGATATALTIAIDLFGYLT